MRCVCSLRFAVLYRFAMSDVADWKRTRFDCGLFITRQNDTSRSYSSNLGHFSLSLVVDDAVL
jgi:hypothetical protein